MKPDVDQPNNNYISRYQRTSSDHWTSQRTILPILPPLGVLEDKLLVFQASWSPSTVKSCKSSNSKIEC